MRLFSLIPVIALSASGACIELSKDRIEARDLGIPALQNDASLIGFTPSPGVVRRIPAVLVGRLLTRAGVPAEGTDGVCIVRGGRTVTREEIVLALRNALQDPAVTIELVSYPDISLPDGVIEFPRAGLIRRGGAEPDHWRGLVRYGPGRTLPFWANVHLAVERKVAVAARDLDAGERVESADVRTETLRIHPLASRSMANPGDVASCIVRKAIRAGAIIGSDSVYTPFDVDRGDHVRIEVTSGRAVLALETTAEARGRTGETIWVRNAANGRRIRVRITGNGTAVPAS